MRRHEPRPVSAAARERQHAAAKRAEQLSVARRNLAHCESELRAPSVALAYVSRPTWEHLREVWQAKIETLSAPRGTR